MKRLKLFALVLLVSPFLANVAREAETPSVAGRFIGGVGLAGAAPVDGFGSLYSGGGGVDGYIGFMLDPNASILLSVDSIIFPTNDPNFYSGEVNFAPSFKYAFGDSKTKFYLIGGLGVNDDIVYYQTFAGTVSASERNFVIEPGAGVDIYLNGALDLYIQAKFIDVFATGGSFSYIPLSVGLGFK